MMMFGTVLFFGLIAVVVIGGLVIFLIRGTGALSQPRPSVPASSPHQEPGASLSKTTATTAKSCSHCGAGLQPDWSHCPQCGAPIQ